MQKKSVTKLWALRLTQQGAEEQLSSGANRLMRTSQLCTVYVLFLVLQLYYACPCYPLTFQVRTR